MTSNTQIHDRPPFWLDTGTISYIVASDSTFDIYKRLFFAIRTGHK